MRRNRNLTRILALLLALSLCITAAGAVTAQDSSMDNFTKTVEYTPFPDAGAWYAADVQKAVELGIMNGKGDGTFDPTGTLSLAEAVTMAAKACSIYTGGKFTPGGSPWYENAVHYAEQEGIILSGEYVDYTQPATRADMAGMFNYVLFNRDMTRINRIASIPDVNAHTSYVDSIYRLYNAGILSGDATGAFHPDDSVTRAEAAAIINRLADPASRKTLNLTTPPAGTLLTSKDGSFHACIPEGWTHGEDDSKGFYCTVNGDEVSLKVFTYSKSEPVDNFTVADAFLQDLIEQDPDAAVEGGVYNVYLQSFRGLDTTRFSYTRGTGTDWRGGYGYCVETSKSVYLILLENKDGCSDAAWAQALDVLYSLDFPL